jgi:hypothetical protein
MTSTPTKADLTAQVSELASQVEQLTERLKEAERPHLRQILWLQGDEPRRSGRTQGGEHWAAFSGQYASRKEGEARRYGAYKDFIAYGDLALAVTEAYEAGDHLVSITAYERPCAPKEGDNRRFSDWVITSFNVVPRQGDQGEQSAQGFESSSEEIPF